MDAYMIKFKSREVFLQYAIRYMMLYMTSTMTVYMIIQYRSKVWIQAGFNVFVLYIVLEFCHWTFRATSNGDVRFYVGWANHLLWAPSENTSETSTHVKDHRARKIEPLLSRQSKPRFKLFGCQGSSRERRRGIMKGSTSFRHRIDVIVVKMTLIPHRLNQIIFQCSVSISGDVESSIIYGGGT